MRAFNIFINLNLFLFFFFQFSVDCLWRAELAVPPHTGATVRARVICSKRTKALATGGASTRPALQNAFQPCDRPRRVVLIVVVAVAYESPRAQRLAVRLHAFSVLLRIFFGILNGQATATVPTICWCYCCGSHRYVVGFECGRRMR